MSAAIVVERLGKAYRHYPSQWARLADWMIPGGHGRATEHWVLRDINFTVYAGEALGIIGMNGAGKSSLLKIIAGTSAPTCGMVRMHGTVAAILELGMGFHPEASGRQNAVLGLQLFGISQTAIPALLQEVETFAEIGSYFDLPVRTYSSGMQVRLAFSVATALRPDVLIVDEALSVGDAYFQHKSFAHIRHLQQQGTTLLLVSHDKAAIQSICQRAILLEQGRIAMVGNPDDVMNQYNILIAAQDAHIEHHSELEIASLSYEAQDPACRLQSISLTNAQSDAISVVEVGEAVHLHLGMQANKILEEITVGFVIKDRLGQDIFGTNTAHLELSIKPMQANESFHVQFSFPMNLGEGHYSISIAVHAGASHIDGNYLWADRALVFHVINRVKARFVGSTWLPVRAQIL